MIAKIVVVLGTRPEVIKMAPVIGALRAAPKVFDVQLFVVGQQMEILDAALAEWRLEPEARIDVAWPRAQLASTIGSALVPLEARIRAAEPNLVMVHGDTSATLAGALAAFYAGVPVAHVEAGLRTGDVSQPFPEEMHRALVDRLSSVLYAPTTTARENLLGEGCDPESIVVVGNSVIDALETVRRPSSVGPRRVVLATGHRRESFGGGARGVCDALRRVVQRHHDIEVKYVLHPHPQAHEVARRSLSGVERIELLAPLAYQEFVGLMESCYLIVTDSGGIQEEAAWLQRPVLVTRDTTERNEAIEAGASRLVGTHSRDVLAAIEALLEPAAYAAMKQVAGPLGGPGASARIRSDLERRGKELLCA